MSSIRVLIADDHQLVREALARLLDAEPDIIVAAQCLDGAAALEAIGAGDIDVAVLDVNMPRYTGLQVAGLVREAGEPTPRVVLLTAQGSPELARRAFERGVKAVVLKDGAFDDLVRAIRCARRGETFVSAALAEGLREAAALSAREIEVLRHIANGLTNKQVAAALGISPKTVDNHRTRIMAKLNAHSTAELVRYAVRAGIVEA